MPSEVLVTARAKQQIATLKGKARKQFDAFLDDLAKRGCAALTYRLSGQTPLDHLCIKHLRADLRVVVAFESAERALILLVGPHNIKDPTINVYSELYRLLGIEPEDDAGRTKPPCCDAIELPPVLGAFVDDILTRAAELRRTRRKG